MVLLTDLPYDVLGEIIKCLNYSDILNLRIVCKETKKMVSKYGTVLFNIYSLDKIQEITKKNNDDKLFRKIMFNLYICSNDPGTENGTIIGEALTVNNSLQILHIRSNCLGKEGGKALGEALTVNNSLHTLYICGYNLNTEGIKAIGEALKVNNSLHTLYINNNNLGVEGGKAIGEALKFNKSLHTLYMWGNNLDDEVKETLRSIASKKEGFGVYL